MKRGSGFPLSGLKVVSAAAVVVGFGVGLMGVYLSMPASDYSFLKLPRTLEELQILRLTRKEIQIRLNEGGENCDQFLRVP